MLVSRIGARTYTLSYPIGSTQQKVLKKISSTFFAKRCPNPGGRAILKASKQDVMNHEVLNSWKEIAAYLGRGVRTVQRWERELQLPVRRPRGKDRSAVIALKSDLDKWLQDTPHRLEPHPLQVHEDNLQLRRNTELLKLRTAKILAQSEKLRATIAESLALTAALTQKRVLLGKAIVSGASAEPAPPGAVKRNSTVLNLTARLPL